VVNAIFTTAAQHFATGWTLGRLHSTSRGVFLRHNVHTAGRGTFAEAADLLKHFGDHAVSEARRRAGQSRNLGNVVHFCRWREVERMIFTLDQTAAVGLVH
jgi:hypothetical protein